MKKILTTLSTGALLLITGAAISQESVDLNQIVAKGDNYEIHVGDVLALMSEMPEEYKTQPNEQLLQDIVNRLATQEILAKEVNEDDETYKYMALQANRYAATNNVLNNYVKENMTEDYLQKTYDELIAQTPPEDEYSAAHILVSTEEEAKALIEKLKAGEDFATLANANTTDPSGKENGGDLGWFGQGEMVPEFEEALTKLEKGAYTEAPVQSQFGWHVIKLNDKRQRPIPTREETDAQLREYARQKLMSEKIDSISKDLKVEIAEGIDPKIIQSEF